MAVAASLALAVRAGEAQSIRQFWPEVDYYQQLSEKSRLFVQLLGAYGSDTIGQDQQFGINYDFSVKRRFTKEGAIGAQSLAEDRHQWLQVRLGYRYQESVDQPSASIQNRLLVEVTLRRPVIGLSAADRNGFDFRWTNGKYSTRYRNRLWLERQVKIDKYEFTPYADAEVAYAITSGEWSYVQYEAGVQLPVLRHYTAEVYLARKYNWTGTPGEINAVGLTVVASY